MAVTVLSLVLVLVLIRWFRVYQRHSKQYGHIPAVGSGNLLESFTTAIQYLYKSDVVIEKGCRQYKGRVFRVPQLTGWLVCVSGEKLVEELRKAPEQIFSATAAQDEFTQTQYTIGPTLREATFHADVLRSTVTKNLGKLIPNMADEIAIAFPEEFDSRLSGESEWMPLKPMDAFLRIVSRVTGRSFVGFPVCRIDEYHQASIQFAANVTTGSIFINVFPEALKPFVGRLFAQITGPRKVVFKHLAPLIRERKAFRAEYGSDYPGKPNDLLQWLMDAAPPGYYSSAEDLSLRMLTMNFASIHTTTLALTNALYDLASYPQHTEPLRQEISDYLGPDMALWTKENMDNCWKLDSFFKESQRMHSSSPLILLRQATQDYTFSDGTIVPTGALISGSQWAVHYDPENYVDPSTFDGFRFSRMREHMRDAKLVAEEDTEEHAGEDVPRVRFTELSPKYVVFGGGRHACPGRFFASMQLKCLLAYIILNYDVKMRKEGARPLDIHFGWYTIARNAEVMFRRRR